VSLLGVPAGTRVELASPNGSTVSLAVDLRLAAEHDVSRAVPRLSGGAFAQLS
jgi:hypothetical protein